MEKLLDMTLLICQGAVVTLEIFVITLMLSLPIGGLAALGRLSNGVLRLDYARYAANVATAIRLLRPANGWNQAAGYCRSAFGVYT